MRTVVLTVITVLAVSTPAAAGPTVSGAWSRPATGANGAGFMTLANEGSRPDVLVSASSPAAARVEIHATTMAGGVASMTKLASVPLASGARTAFAPGGRHLMLMGLTRPLKAGDRFPVTLTFASGAKVTATFTVSVAAPSEGHAHH